MPGGLEYSDPAVGIDLGTSNTVAVVRQGDGRIRPLLFDGLPVTPSAVYLDERGHLHVGRDAYRLAQVDPARCEPNPKRRIDDQTVLLGDGEVPVVDMLAAILRSVAAKATEACATLPPAVLTYPATWGSRRRRVMRDAAAMAGWPDVAMLPEPIAAAHYYVNLLSRPLPPGAALAVFDFGGGTVDVAVVANDAGRFVVLGAAGLPELGGLDVDAVLVGHLGAVLSHAMPAHWRQLSSPRNASERRQRRAFWEDVRGAKEMLSRSAMAPVVVPGADRPVHLTREELESLASPLIRQVVALTADTIERCGLDPARLAGVFLVGGASRIPLVARMLHTRLGVAPTVLEQPELPVAEGALLAVARGEYDDAEADIKPDSPTRVLPQPPPQPPPQALPQPQPQLAPEPPRPQPQAPPEPPRPQPQAPPEPPHLPPAEPQHAPPEPPRPEPAPQPAVAPTRWRAVAGVPVRTPSEHEPDATPSPPPSQDGRRRWRKPLVAGVVVLVLLGALVIAAILNAGRDRAGTSSGSQTGLRETGSLAVPASAAQSLDIDHDYAYVGLQGSGGPEVAKIALASGQTLWRKASGTGKLASIDAGTAVIVVRAAATGTDPAPVTVLDAGSGDKLWGFTARESDEVRLRGERVLFVDHTADKLVGYDHRSGTELWEHGLSGSKLTFGTTFSDEQNARSLDGRRIFASDASAERKVFRIDANGASRVLDAVDRSVDARGSNVGGANDLFLVYGDVVLVADNKAGYTLRAFKLSDLSPLWTSQPQAGRTPRHLDACGEHRACVLDGNGELSVFDLGNNGARIWGKKAQDAAYTASVGTFVMATYRQADGRLGTTLWKDTGDEAANLPGVLAGRLDGTHLLLVSAVEGSPGPATVNLARLDVTTTARTEFGALKIDSSRCTYNAEYLVCPTPDAVKVWRM